jgi:hypothetical protein
MKILYLNYYRDKDIKRDEELRNCLEYNIANPEIDHIVLLADEAIELPCFFPEKVLIRTVDKRPTYNDFFEATQHYYSAGDIIHIIANSDIFFDQVGLSLLDKISLDNKCLALTRWDIQSDGSAKCHNNIGSQDVWIFKGNIRPIDGNFHLGKRGCDNRIAHEIEKAGYKVENPCHDVICYHLHLSNVRNYSTKGDADVIPPPYKYVPFTRLQAKIDGSSMSIASVIASAIEPVKPAAKRIMHIALNAGGKRQEALCKALESMGEYLEIDWMAIRDKYGIAYLRNYILDMDKQFMPDLIFMQIQTAKVIDNVIAGQLGGFVVNWTGDVRQPIPDWYEEVGREIDLTLFSNEADVEVFKKKNLRAEFLNIGFDETVFSPHPCPSPEGEGLKPEIVFLGSHYGVDAFPLSRFRYELVKALKDEFGGAFQCYGNGWDFPSRMLNEQQEAQVYRGCKVAINCSHFNLERYFSDRLLRILGSGAYCLSHDYPGIEKDFPHLDIFNSIPELIESIKIILSNDHIREEMAKANCREAHAKHTWAHRIEQLKSLTGWEKISTPRNTGIKSIYRSAEQVSAE